MDTLIIAVLCFAAGVLIGALIVTHRLAAKQIVVSAKSEAEKVL